MLVLDTPSIAEGAAGAGVTALLIAIAGIGLAVIKSRRATSAPTAGKRWISGVLIGIVALSCIIFGGIPFALFITAVSLLAAGELLRLLGATRPPVFDILAHIANLSIVLCAWIESSRFIQAGPQALLHSNLADMATLLWVVVLVLVPVFSGRFRNMPAQEAKSILTIIFTGLFLSHLVLLRGTENGFGATMFLVACVAANDTLAYIAGSLFGKTKLSAFLSPKKTIEGVIAGTVGTLVFASSAVWLLPGLALPAVACLVLTVVLLAPCGDLAISVIKRDAGVKDSSGLIPGHGGILDRAGSFLLVSPVYYYAYALASGLLKLHF